MSRLFAIWILVLATGVGPLAAQEKSLNLTTRFDDNLGLARASADVVEDISILGEASIAWHRQFDVRTSADFSTSLSAEHFLRTEDFDSLTLLGTASLNHKIGLGAGLSKPLLTLQAQLGWLNSEEKFRSGIPYGLQLSGRSRLLNRAVFSYRLGWSGFEPDVNYRVPIGVNQRGDAWRWKQFELGANYAMLLGSRWSAAVDIARFDGDLVFTTAPTNILNAVGQARAPDHALGDTFYAYRVEGEGWQSSLALAFVPVAGQQIQLRLGRLFSQSDAGIGYDRTWLEMSWSRSF